MARLSNNRSIRQSRKLYAFIGLHLFMGFGAIAFGLFLIINSPTKDYPFWIAVIIEIGLAFGAVLVRRYSRTITFLIILFSALAPGILAANISLLKPIWNSSFICITTMAAIFMFLRIDRRLKNEPSSIKLPPKVTFDAVFPTELPSGFTERDHHIHKKKQQTTLEIYYQNVDDASWLWIYESDGVLIRDEIKLQTQKLDKVINGIHISIAQGFPKINSLLASFQKEPDMLYIEAIWKHNNINFNLRSDGISLGDVEKIISSMTK